MVNFGSPFASSTFSRVSSVLARNVVLANLTRNQQDLLRLQEELSSGLLINRPSDDPTGAGRVMSYIASLSRNDTFQKNIKEATGRLAMSDGSLSSATDALVQAQQIFQDQRGGAADAQSRAQAATQVDLLLQDAVRQANARFEGRSLFGGSRTGVDPFQIQGDAVVFNGNLDRLQADISDGIRMVTNVTGDAWGGLSDEIRGLDPATMLPIDLNPRASLNTRLTDLNAGRGVALGSISITVGAVTTNVDLRTAKTVGDVRDLITDAGTGVTATFNAATNTLDFTSASPFSIQDVSNGTTAQDLGIDVSGPGGPAVSSAPFDPVLAKDTALGDLFGGSPALDSSGLVITNKTAGQTFTSTIGSSVFGAANTVEDVLNAINASGTHVHAQLNAQGTGIDVVSTLSGGRLTIAENGGTTATQLGLLSTFARARIADLNNGLGVDTIAGADLKITRKDGTTVLFDVDNAQTVQDLVKTIDADPGLTATISGSSITITDTTGGAGSLTIENVGAGFAATQLGIAGSVPGTTIAGTPVSFAGVQTDGIFTALIRLRDALAADNVGAMDTASRLVDSAREKLSDARGEVGSRTSSLEMTQNRLDLEKTELEKLRSSTQDVDMATAATQFQIQQTVLQASLAAAARILQTTLLNYLPLQ
jgi:flagellar hook-associated protein 3 FlgL